MSQKEGMEGGRENLDRISSPGTGIAALGTRKRGVRAQGAVTMRWVPEAYLLTFNGAGSEEWDSFFMVCETQGCCQQGWVHATLLSVTFVRRLVGVTPPIKLRGRPRFCTLLWVQCHQDFQRDFDSQQSTTNHWQVTHH